MAGRDQRDGALPHYFDYAGRAILLVERREGAIHDPGRQASFRGAEKLKESWVGPLVKLMAAASRRGEEDCHDRSRTPAPD